MAPSYKDQVAEVRGYLSQATAESIILKKDLKEALTALCSIYRGLAATVTRLRSIEPVRELIPEEMTFFKLADLRVQSSNTLADHILQAIEVLAVCSGKLGLELRGIRSELYATEEINQTYRDSGCYGASPDLDSPIGHLSSALEMLEKEDQSLRAQLRVSEEKRLRSLQETDVKDERMEKQLEDLPAPGKKQVKKAIKK
jgi:hypothetical protein